MAIPTYTFASGGGIAVGLAVSSFSVLSLIAKFAKEPKLSHLSSAVFGLVYCGVLPAYWVKLRLAAVPAIHTAFAAHWPLPFGGLTHVTVGLLATFTTIASVVAADVGAYFVGTAWGRTPLTLVSPNKTVEGAAGGLVCCVACTLALRCATQWPLAPASAVGLGAVTFVAALLGDLIESAMKRDAGVKDSGSLIPGHGGILDRFDSYVFTAALVYLYLQLPPVMGV